MADRRLVRVALSLKAAKKKFRIGPAALAPRIKKIWFGIGERERPRESSTVESHKARLPFSLVENVVRLCDVPKCQIWRTRRTQMSRLRLHPEEHLVARIGWLRAAVLGANDGIVSTASLIVGVAAAAATQNDVLIAGVSGLVAGAMSMAAGEYVSVSSQSDTEQADLARERKELSENAAFELDELADIYVKRGVDQALATQVAKQLMATDALTAHAREELGISEITTARPIQAALTSAATFSAGAAMPLLMVVVSPASALVPYRVRRIFRLSCASRRVRSKSRWCEYPARHLQSDILGRAGDGPDGRHREIVRNGGVSLAEETISRW
jgi:vacuolar iron transporter family protein